MKAHVVNEVAVVNSARVMQMSGMFDVPAAEKARLEWNVDLPIEDRSWNIGLIVGPSGAGKTSIARALFGDRVVSGFDWSPVHAVLDDFPAGLSIRDVANLLTAVGFGSPPAWMRPFGTLSNGEQFRVMCARALAESSELVVLDEFTSVVDRQVAKVASSTIAKTVRRSKRQLVAVTCHFDVADWLQPDWVFQPHTGHFEWRSVQPRPPVEIAIHPVGRDTWPLFRAHHYLSAHLLASAKCFVGFVDDEPVAFVSHAPFPHPRVKDIRMLHRTVVLPDWQGLGIAGHMTEWLARQLVADGWRCRTVTAHPARVAALLRSPRWRVCARPTGKTSNLVSSAGSSKSLRKKQGATRRLNTWSFEYVPGAGERRPVKPANRVLRVPAIPGGTRVAV